jgi:hypothetical protein
VRAGGFKENRIEAMLFEHVHGGAGVGDED